jgi:hypothetical protein
MTMLAEENRQLEVKAAKRTDSNAGRTRRRIVGGP